LCKKQEEEKMPGKVYIMGVGPGDYKLMTLKAAECIEKADVIVYDRLVGSRILSRARKDAELVYVGKMPDCHAVPQEEINHILVRKAQEGKTVARVKGGDPFVFGRGGEEAETLRQYGIDFEIVPGVTSAVAVPAYAGIPVTHRDFCSSLHIITGHERPDKDESSIDYPVLAKVRGTLVFLMGVKNLSEICSKLILHGKESTTPAAVIEKGTTMEQRMVSGTLADIAGKVSDAGISSPAVTVIGEVAQLHDRLKWFPAGKLAGKRVIVTRSREQASSLVEKIEALGGEAVEFPTIRTEAPEDYCLFDAALGVLGTYDWIVFTSVNGVISFFERLRQKGRDIRSLAGAKLCAVGKATGDELGRLCLKAEYIPEKYTTEELLKGMAERVRPGDRVLLARADIADVGLPQGLKDRGCHVTDLVVYRTVPDGKNREEVLEMLAANSVQWITFTSSSTVRNFVSVLGEGAAERLLGVKVACIGPVIAKTADELGIIVHTIAEEHTIDGLLEKLVEGN
jgi:uroporphyrinogen III methyltransferase / synthase